MSTCGMQNPLSQTGGGSTCGMQYPQTGGGSRRRRRSTKKNHRKRSGTRKVRGHGRKRSCRCPGGCTEVHAPAIADALNLVAQKDATNVDANVNKN